MPDSQQLEARYTIAQEAALKAGELLAEHFGKDLQVRFKGETDPVTNLDLAAETLIVDLIKGAFPDDSILAEEGGNQQADETVRWIIDPLDGTVNYLHSYPFFCVSIALEVAGEIVLGVVYAPVLRELFVARKGQGAFLQNKQITVSSAQTLHKSLLVTGFPYNLKTVAKNNLACFNRFALTAQGVRRDGSAALDLCYVAAGRFDGFWEPDLKPWDVAAGILLVTEAGGLVSCYDGSLYTLGHQEIVAANPLIHSLMLAEFAALGAAV